METSSIFSRIQEDNSWIVVARNSQQIAILSTQRTQEAAHKILEMKAFDLKNFPLTEDTEFFVEKKSNFFHLGIPPEVKE